MRAVLGIVGTSIVLAASASAQGGLLLQGIVDGEAWKTDTGSNLLTRHRGNSGQLVRVQLWSAVEPWRGVFFFAQGEVEGGNARAFGLRATDVELDQGGVRIARDPRFVVNIGKMFHPVGAFAPRIFSTRNPLIGIPDGYSPVYPTGAMVSGDAGGWDYRAAVVSRPLTHRGYQPDADDAYRPVVGVGYSPITGLRFGASATTGPYLNKDLTPSQTEGKSWKDFRQTQFAGDAEWGYRHLDLRAEYAYATFDVPVNGSISGQTGYVEARYTVTPRLFVAGRGEINHYPFIRPATSTTWTSRPTEFSDWEAGFGFRATASTLIKASYRADAWTVTPANAAFIRPGGKAWALQVSQSFDVMEMVSAAARQY